MPTSFDEMLAAGYGFTEPSVTLGAALEKGTTVHPEPQLRVPLAMMNRHGLIAGATGTGKTKTLQLLTEQLSAQAFPCSPPTSRAISPVSPARRGQRSPVTEPRPQRHRVGVEAWGVPGRVLVSLSGKLGVQLRATVSSFGPLLLGQGALAQRHADQRAHDGLQVL